MAQESIDGKVQRSNFKCQLKSQCLMSNFVFCNLDFGIDLTFGYWNLSLNTPSFLIPVSDISYALQLTILS